MPRLLVSLRFSVYTPSSVSCSLRTEVILFNTVEEADTAYTQIVTDYPEEGGMRAKVTKLYTSSSV